MHDNTNHLHCGLQRFPEHSACVFFFNLSFVSCIFIASHFVDLYTLWRVAKPYSFMKKKFDDFSLSFYMDFAHKLIRHKHTSAPRTTVWVCLMYILWVYFVPYAYFIINFDLFVQVLCLHFHSLDREENGEAESVEMLLNDAYTKAICCRMLFGAHFFFGDFR